MRGKWFFLAMLGAIQLSSCQRKSFDPTLAGAFFPLRPGLSWTYRMIDEGRGTTQIFTDRVIGQRRLAGQDANEVESEYSGPVGTLSSSIIYFREDGYLSRQFTMEPTTQTVLAEKAFLPQRLEPHQSWSNSMVLFAQEPEFRVVQTHRSFFDRGTVDVPAGHFSGCIRIETIALYQSKPSTKAPPMSLRYFDWYAPNVGLVKTLVRQSGFFGSELARVELLDFRPQPRIATRRTAPRSNVSLQGELPFAVIP